MRKSAEERDSQALNVSLGVVMAHSSMPGRANCCSRLRNATGKGATAGAWESRSQEIVQETNFSSLGLRVTWKLASEVVKEVGRGEKSRQVARRTSSSP